MIEMISRECFSLIKALLANYLCNMAWKMLQRIRGAQSIVRQTFNCQHTRLAHLVDLWSGSKFIFHKLSSSWTSLNFAAPDENENCHEPLIARMKQKTIAQNFPHNDPGRGEQEWHCDQLIEKVVQGVHSQKWVSWVVTVTLIKFSLVEVQVELNSHFTVSDSTKSPAGVVFE